MSVVKVRYGSRLCENSYIDKLYKMRFSNMTFNVMSAALSVIQRLFLAGPHPFPRDSPCGKSCGRGCRWPIGDSARPCGSRRGAGLSERGGVGVPCASATLKRSIPPMIIAARAVIKRVTCCIHRPTSRRKIQSGRWRHLSCLVRRNRSQWRKTQPEVIAAAGAYALASARCLQVGTRARTIASSAGPVTALSAPSDHREA
jgi:hypothetical protein